MGLDAYAQSDISDTDIGFLYSIEQILFINVTLLLDKAENMKSRSSLPE